MKLEAHVFRAEVKLRRSVRVRLWLSRRLGRPVFGWDHPHHWTDVQKAVSDEVARRVIFGDAGACTFDIDAHPEHVGQWPEPKGD